MPTEQEYRRILKTLPNETRVALLYLEEKAQELHSLGFAITKDALIREVASAVIQTLQPQIDAEKKTIERLSNRLALEKQATEAAYRKMLLVYDDIKTINDKMLQLRFEVMALVNAVGFDDKERMKALTAEIDKAMEESPPRYLTERGRSGENVGDDTV